MRHGGRLGARERERKGRRERERKGRRERGGGKEREGGRGWEPVRDEYPSLLLWMELINAYFLLQHIITFKEFF